MKLKVRFQVSIAVIILFFIVALTAVMMNSLYVVSSRVAKETGSTLFEAVVHGAHERIDNQLGGTLALARFGASHPGLEVVDGDGLDAKVLPFFFTVLTENSSLYSLYFGLDDGAFFQVIAARDDPEILATHNAPEETMWIVRIISGQGLERVQTWTYLDSARKPLGTALDTKPGFDPRRRPWYETAMASDDAELSQPYIFASLQKPGITASRRFANGVFGVDITLVGLNDFVKGQVISPHGGMMIFDRSMRILAMTNGLPTDGKVLTEISKNAARPMVQAVARLWGQHHATDGMLFDKLGEDHLMVYLAEWEPGENYSIGIAVVAPTDDFTDRIRAMQGRILWLALACLGVFLVFGILVARQMSLGVRALAADALRIRNMDFSGDRQRASHIIEFNELGEAFHLMKQTIARRTHALEDAEKKLARLVDLGIALSAEHDGNRLMEMILVGAKELTNADGATLYTRGEDDHLHFQMLRNDTLERTSGDDSITEITMPPVPMFDQAGEPNLHNVVSLAAHQQQTVVIDDAYASTSFDFSGTRSFDERNHYRSTSFMTVPLKPRGGTVIGALQLINARLPDTDQVVPFPPEIQRFVEALAAQAATALENRNLLAEQDRLMESIIQMVANAIDAKSPYTGGHCTRVPELALMLAEEAVKESDGPLAEFHFAGEKEWREFRIGAWLHDCGKLITPEYIVDKATKLEVVYNRIHEIRMRFEVLLRDAEIARLEAIAEGRSPEEAQDACDSLKAHLLDDFAFIAECNIGDKLMTPERIDRLKEIAKTTWLRAIDDRQGLSHSETKRFADIQAEPLPVVESVLTNKPWHVVPRVGDIEHRYRDLKFEIKVPENQYDLGEINNLSIRQGTLTEEDRFKINEHVMQTIAMLERLAFPEHLKRVPEYAGTHHETLAGTGYPRKLDAAQLSVPSRIIAIADIFEALTASDRPYKRAKTLSESIKILSFFKSDGLIDPNLFDLFLTSGVHQRYAERFLSDDQIDTVDIREYLRST